MSKFLTQLLLSCLCFSVGGCAQQSAVPPPADKAVVSESQDNINFSGSWEMDYGRSDNVDDRLRSIYNEYRRLAERRARSGSGEYGGGGAGAAVSNAMSSIVPLARLADFITTSQVLDIEHSEAEILVEREDTFALGCTFHDDTPAPVVAELGSEICGWDAHQLVFLVSLPDGTRINHRMTIAADGQRLHIASTVSRKSSAQSFTLNRVYYKFNPLPPDYSCQYTLSKGNVCSRTAS